MPSQPPHSLFRPGCNTCKRLVPALRLFSLVGCQLHSELDQGNESLIRNLSVPLIHHGLRECRFGQSHHINLLGFVARYNPKLTLNCDLDQWTTAHGTTRCLVPASNSTRLHRGVYLKQVNHNHLRMAYASQTYQGGRDSFNIDIMIHVERPSYTKNHLLRPGEDTPLLRCLVVP